MGFTLAEICGQNMLVLPRIFRFSAIDLFMVFSTFDMDKLGKIRRHHWKSVLKLIKLLSLKLICWKLMKKQLLKVLKIYRLLYGGGTNLHPAIQTSVNFRNFVELYLCSLKMLSLSNLAIIWSNCWIPRHSVPPLFSLVGVLWRTKHNTIDAILIQWHANKWQGILQLSQ